MCSCQTRRLLPPCVFYGMINIILVNSYVIYENNTVKNLEKPVFTQDFWWQHSLRTTTTIYTVPSSCDKNLSHPLCQSITNILGVTVSTPQSNITEPQGREICAYCPAKKRRMTIYFSGHCTKVMCGELRKAVFSMYWANISLKIFQLL